MKKIKITTSFLLIFLSFNLYSQISGISASKLVVINSETVPTNNIEFEPSFNFSVSKQDSLITNSGFGFRFSYGLNSKTEIGISIPVNLNTLNWGIKYHLHDYNKISTALIAGIQNSLIVNESENNNYMSLFNSFSTGTAITYKINNKISIDIDNQFQTYFYNPEKNYNIFLNSEIGYFISEGLQLACGLQYGNNHLYGNVYNELIINSGITVEKAENFILVMNFPYKVKNTNTASAIGFNMALTVLID